MPEMFATQKDLDMFVLLHEMEGASSGAIAVESGEDRELIKGYMLKFERMGLGEYTLFDGMWNFWFSPFGHEVYIRMKHEGEV